MTRSAAITALLLACVASLYASRQQQDAADNVILITLDGARTEEIFGGLDADILRSTLKDSQAVEQSPMYKRFWAPTREERRRKLLPFFWSLVTEHGSIAGDVNAHSVVKLRNRHWFSYPGYSEILVGSPHDDTIKSNDPVRNPFTTVLEAISRDLKLPRNSVATFAGWGVFNEIVEHHEGATFVNAGIEPLTEAADVETRLLNTAQAEALPPWQNMRYDVFTFRLAMKYLAAERPKVFYLALGETDDWAHDGRYDQVLEAYSRTDGYLRELWTWLQEQPDYRGKTHLLITTDHGRGRTAKDWRDHGAKIDGAENVWIAFSSPSMKTRGLWRDHSPLSTSQVAATLATWVGVDWNRSQPDAGHPIRD